MRQAVPTSGDYEAEANRLRAAIGSTIEELRYGLKPSNLASEAASRVGIADLSWGGVFDFASKRHPIPTAIIGLGLALWTLSAMRRRARTEGGASLTSSLNETSGSLVDSTTKVLRTVLKPSGNNSSASPRRKSRLERGDLPMRLKESWRMLSVGSRAVLRFARSSSPWFRSFFRLR